MPTVLATEAHCLELGRRMRAADALEVDRAGGNSPTDAALKSMRASKECWAVFEQGELLAVWGVVEFFPGIGASWLLTTTSVDRFPLTFWRTSKVHIRELRGRWQHLFNFIDAEYSAAISWARRLGLTVAEPAPFGLLGLPFCRVDLLQPRPPDV
jgi:hypothetical protein